MRLLKLISDVATKLPLSVVKDVVTMDGMVNDRETHVSKVLREIDRDIFEEDR